MKILKNKKLIYVLCAVLCLCSLQLYSLADDRYDKTKYDDLYMYHYATSGLYSEKGPDGYPVYEQMYYNLDSNTEVVAFEFYEDNSYGIGFISKSLCTGYYSSEVYNKHYSVNGTSQRRTQYVDTYMGGNIKLFDTYEHALAYLETGSTNGLKRGADINYDSDNIYFKKFDVIVHTSNSAENFYFDFVYDLSDYMKEHKDVAGFDLYPEYLLSVSAFSGTFNLDIPGFTGSNDYWHRNSIAEYANSFRFPFHFDVDTKYEWFNKIMNESAYEIVCGKELILDTNKLEIADFGASTVLEIDKSYITFIITPYVGDDYGQKYYYNYNFLTGTGQVTSSRVEADGTETSNNDLKTSDGHYHTKASKDAAGNVTYNYYYYPAGGMPYEVSPDDVKNNTTGNGSSSSINGSITINNNITNNIPSGSGLGGGSSSDNITINDDDLTKDGLANAIKYGFNIFDDMDTGEKGDGILALITDFYAYLPGDIGGLTRFGVACTVGVSIILLILGRRR